MQLRAIGDGESHFEEGAIDLSPYPNVKAWMGRIEKLPGFKKYDALLPQQVAILGDALGIVEGGGGEPRQCLPPA